jgi:hypothetical protein
MNTLPKTALVALVAGTIGLTAAVPAAFAQDASPAPSQPMVRHHQFDGGKNHPGWGHRPGMNRPGLRHHMAGRGMGPMGMGGMGGLVNIACSPRGAEALEIAFVRLSYRVDLTDAQQPLFDDLKTAALDAQKDFADTCTAARPQKGAMPDPLAAYKARIAVESAHVDALNTVMPKFEAFIGSLDDAQKAKLVPQRPMRGQHGNAIRNPAAPVPPAPGAQPPATPDTPASPTSVQG